MQAGDLINICYNDLMKLGRGKDQRMSKGSRSSWSALLVDNRIFSSSGKCPDPFTIPDILIYFYILIFQVNMENLYRGGPCNPLGENFLLIPTYVQKNSL